MFSERKYIYNLFKKYKFDENFVFTQYNELRPKKLYKILIVNLSRGFLSYFEL